ncbi:MAG: Fe-S-containing protein [Eubacterium sp.]|nr:Fe-S-containing protein [Eubacterium sp.]
MLKYLISTLEYLIVPGVLIGMMIAYIHGCCGHTGRKILMWGVMAGCAAACVLAYLKNKTKLIDTANLNMVIFSISLAALVIFLIVDGRKKEDEGNGDIVTAVPAAVLVFIQVFYSLPDVIAFPYTIMLSGESFFSTGFLYRVIGIALGAALVIVTALAAYFVCRRIRIRATGVLLKIALLIVAAQQVTKILQTLLTRRYISGKALFQLIKFTSNHANLFVLGVILAVFFMPVILWIRSFHVNEPYSNPAEHRKIRANWRSIRRWSTALLVCLVLAFINMTAVKAWESRPVELSPTEECEQRGDAMYVSFAQVEDGHLHRFAYTSENGVAIRFIIIKKPNSSAYGVGLDACDICGETGYYERGDQVVCNRCDVVMNVNTIGFKGGCNPKVIDYSVEDGYIIVPTATLLEHEKDFS